MALYQISFLYKPIVILSKVAILYILFSQMLFSLMAFLQVVGDNTSNRNFLINQVWSSVKPCGYPCKGTVLTMLSQQLTHNITITHPNINCPQPSHSKFFIGQCDKWSMPSSILSCRIGYLILIGYKCWPGYGYLHHKMECDRTVIDYAFALAQHNDGNINSILFFL